MGAVKSIKMAPRVVEHPGTRTTDSLEATVIDQSLAPSAPPHTRELRALALVQARGHEIVRTSPWTYNVPSCTGEDFYVVDYRRESCECEDYRRRGVPCKHVYAVGLHRAKRRGGSGL
jgi:hypothetical protein